MSSSLRFCTTPATLLALSFAAGCAAPAQPAPVTPCPAPPPAPPAVTPAPTVAPVGGAPLTACPSGLKATPDGLFDDFEDGTSQVAVLDGRAGYWWVAKAEHASITSPGPEFRTSDGGPAGSTRAAHFAGKTDARDQWGAALGGNFLGGGFYDASKYAGVSFKIKGLAKGFVRFKLHDVNTHPDGAVCQKECWNAFGKTIELTGDWQSLELAFAELRQLDGWGLPRPSSLTPSKVKHLEWAVEQGETFDFWVDEIRLLSCK
jgi:hypothetical protein